MQDVNTTTGTIINSAIRIHRALGPGLLESAYEACLAHDLRKRGLRVQRQVSVPLEFEDLFVPRAYRIDLLVEEQVVVEIKAQPIMPSLFEAQIISHIRLSGLRVGLLINFHVGLLKDGIRRFVV
jgi:GxxExxY protein